MRDEARDISRTAFHLVHVVLTLDVGGLERGVINQVRQGQSLGQRVSVVCLDSAGTLAARVEAMGARVIVIGRDPGLRPSLIVKLRRVFRELRPAVVHTHQLATLLYAGAAARSLRVPVIVHTEHGRELYATRRRTRWLGRIAARLCHRFFCLTDEMAGNVRRFRIAPAAKVRVIQNGIDIEQFTQASADRAETRKAFGIPADVLVIGTVGRLSEVKRQDVLLNAFAGVVVTHPTAHLLIVGDGPLWGELDALAKSLGIDRSVHLVGYQPHSGPFLRAMDVFALTSRSEGMPQAVLEASVTGLPAVVSNVGGLPEVVEDGVTGRLFPVGNEGALAGILNELLADREQRRRLGEAGRARVESKFSVKRMAREYHEQFVELLARRTTARRSFDAATLARLAGEQ